MTNKYTKEIHELKVTLAKCEFTFSSIGFWITLRLYTELRKEDAS